MAADDADAPRREPRTPPRKALRHPSGSATSSPPGDTAALEPSRGEPEAALAVEAGDDAEVAELGRLLERKAVVHEDAQAGDTGAVVEPVPEKAPADAAPRLRKYQRKMLRKLAAALEADKPARVLAYLPTGGGKTLLASKLVRLVLDEGLCQRCVFMVNRTALVEQTARAFASCGLDDVGFIKAGRPGNATSPVQVASIQSVFGARKGSGAATAGLEGAELVIVDEAHGVLAAQYLKLLDKLPAAHVVGLTATPFRLKDDESLSQVFSDMVRGPSVSEMIRREYLVEPLVFAPSTARNSKLDSKVAQDAATLDSAVARWRAECSGKRTIAFCVTIKQSKALVARIKAAGFEAAHVDGSTSERERSAAFAMLADGELHVLSSVGVLSEGFDEPSIEVVLMLRPTESRGLFVQQLGRGLRPAAGKRRCIVLDEVGNVYRHGPVDGPEGFAWESLADVDDEKRQSKSKGRWVRNAAAQMLRFCKTPRCDVLLHREGAALRCAVCVEWRRAREEARKAEEAEEDAAAAKAKQAKAARKASKARQQPASPADDLEQMLAGLSMN